MVFTTKFMSFAGANCYSSQNSIFNISQADETVSIGRSKYVVSKTPVKITKENYLSIQMAEVLRQLTPVQVVKYSAKLQEIPIDKADTFKGVLSMYPASVSKKAILGDLI